MKQDFKLLILTWMSESRISECFVDCLNRGYADLKLQEALAGQGGGSWQN